MFIELNEFNKLVMHLNSCSMDLGRDTRSDMLANITSKSFDQEKLFETREYINLLVTSFFFFFLNLCRDLTVETEAEK